MFLKSILSATVISVDQVGVVPWCLIWWFIWFVIHTLYRKCFLLLLKRININEDNSKELVKLYWNIAFTSISVPFALQNLKLSYTDIIDRFYYVLENHIATWFSSKPFPSVHTKLSYVILSGYYLNIIFETCVEKGWYSWEFVMNELLTLFFISTFPLRCVQFGVAVTTIINFVDFFLSISKLLTIFCNIAQTKCMRFLIHIFLLLHSIFWAFVYINILPRYFIYTSIKKMKLRSDLGHWSLYLLLNGSLFGLYILALTKSTVTKLLIRFIRRQPSLRFLLFQSEIKENEVNSLITEKERDQEKIRLAKKKENLLKLYLTVKCAIRIKRKLNKIRSRRKECDCVGTCHQDHPATENEAMDCNNLDNSEFKKCAHIEEMEELVER